MKRTARIGILLSCGLAAAGKKLMNPGQWTVTIAVEGLPSQVLPKEFSPQIALFSEL